MVIQTCDSVKTLESPLVDESSGYQKRCHSGNKSTEIDGLSTGLSSHEDDQIISSLVLSAVDFSDSRTEMKCQGTGR